MGLSSANSITQYKKAIAEYLEIESTSVSLFWKGRIALYSLLKALDIKKGDEIIVPAFTCVVVPNAIIYLGAIPVYVDIDPLTYNIDIDKIESKITSKTKVILAQNTFGLSPDLDKIFEIARKHNLKVVEDCTHGFGGSYKGKKNGTIADASFYSTQWNKPFSTGIGGIAVVKDPKLAERLNQIEADAIAPTNKEALFLKTLIFVREKLLIPSIYWPAVKLYRFLSKNNLIIGSSQGEELQAPKYFPEFLKGMTEIQAEKGIEGLKKIDNDNRHRIITANKYKEFFFKMGFENIFQPEYAEHTFLKFPILVKNRKEFIELAEKNNIELGEWFTSPIHPISENHHLWNYEYGQNPIAEDVSQKIVNLPTHRDINNEQLGNIFNFLTRNKDSLLMPKII
ncbi:MAG: aminotransferase class I/II-fold pyridoxal phosphate-dependent enzyme [Bacteroidota bacterium]|nr:aminotransferase class I/II-fold pyridoxal phosphate-dependent enzyme [Bacteroidota bacterium]